MKRIVASRGRYDGREWVQRLEVQEETTNTLTCVWKDNMVLEECEFNAEGQATDSD